MSKITVDDLAQEIRRVDGNHDLGAGALAEALMPFIEADYPAIEGQGEVKVKPMEWAFSPDGSYRHCAETITGIYWISQNGPDEFYLERDITSIGGWRKSLDEAKAAAQADYERRILSAITEEP